MTNEELKKKASDCGLFLWQVARAAGISSGTLSIWLRENPLPEEKLNRLLNGIEKEVKRRGG